MRLNIAGWLLELGCTPPEVADAVERRYAPFAVAPDGPPDLAVTVEFLPSLGPEARQHPLLEAQLIAVEGGYALDEREIRGKITLIEQRASLCLSSPDPLRDLEYFLRVVIALWAYHDGGLLVHGAALVVDGRAHLFVGQSGSGKSTVVALSPHAAALGDDLVLLRPTGDGWTVYGTPFWNWQAGSRSGQTGQGRLQGIYKLVQAPHIRLEPMTLAAATAEIVANCPIVNDAAELLPGLLLECRRLAASVPVNRLHFRKDNTFWSLIEPEIAVA